MAADVGFCGGGVVWLWCGWHWRGRPRRHALHDGHMTCKQFRRVSGQDQANNETRRAGSGWWFQFPPGPGRRRWVQAMSEI